MNVRFSPLTVGPIPRRETRMPNFLCGVLVPDAPLPRPLPPGERDLTSPSLDGREQRKGDNQLKSIAQFL